MFVPWVLTTASKKPQPATLPETQPPQVFNRYYHMFAQGELAELVRDAAEGIGLYVGEETEASPQGVEIVQDGWERSNYYVELRCWQH